ncbi:SRPBCC domain-containing protein [Microbacterium sp.]|uniref:SRPBCC family protein n=1 Tax=Microbacterium sp. TaxID=51671 RepID=UPI002D77D08F|nr:SRPBCC domain-containing protein [Microbacterium sp.]HET6301003.1 SRPBCC domain-containing protein [Microbacterium sp.]
MSHTVQSQTIGLRVSREVPATPDEVFTAYTDPEAQRVWLSQLGPDVGQVRTTVDLRIGGVWEATFFANPSVLVHDVFTFLEVDRPRRLVTGHVGESTVDGRAQPPIRTHIEVTFAPTDAGTLITVDHTGFADTQTRDFFENVAWPGGLDRLAAYVAERR